MVQGLAFLSKKSWHTKNLANQEKVWIAEQRKAQEETKTKELARQIQQEREREEFDRLAGKKTLLDRGIDWMYQGQAAVTGEDEDGKPSAVELEDAEKRTEDFLCGKEYAAEGGKADGDFTEGANEGVNAVVKLEPRGAAAMAAAAASKSSAQASSTYGHANSTAETSVADRNEAFRQRVEDPMFRVGQKEREKKTEARKQQALYERVVGPTEAAGGSDDDDDGIAHEKTKSKHERKRERKERRRKEKDVKKKKRRHRSDDSDEEDRYERKRRRRRDDSSDDDDNGDAKNRKIRRNHRDGKDRHGRSSRYDSDSDRERSHRRRDDDNRKRRSHGGGGSSSKRHHHESNRSHRSKSRSPEESRHHNRRDNRHTTDRDRDHHRRSHEEDRSLRRDDDRSRHNNLMQDGPPKKEGFGLQGKASVPSNTTNSKDLGPQQDLVRQKRKAAEDQRHRARNRASSRRTMTAEERAQALHEMQATAQNRNRDTSSRRDEEDEDEDEAPKTAKATFIKDLNEQTHGLKGGGSLSSRMAQNRNGQQRINDEAL